MHYGFGTIHSYVAWHTGLITANLLLILTEMRILDHEAAVSMAIMIAILTAAGVCGIEAYAGSMFEDDWYGRFHLPSMLLFTGIVILWKPLAPWADWNPARRPQVWLIMLIIWETWSLITDRIDITLEWK
ncbi:hypothetical protein [Bifidobacterium sp. SO1]|uniref:hypothetical protein n=1 Tax=Bifidobacterium sp. SO1 TaxID=2809029 RepID=UPI001BDBFEE3|nr:hypothetical protein [Bifidobacterium sp. SO1]MBT1161815.1 hypothetical protein [Bifidobacterium sp. SO1]